SKSLPRVRAGVRSYETGENHSHGRSFALIHNVAFRSRSSDQGGAEQGQAEQKIREKIGRIKRRSRFARIRANSSEIGAAGAGRKLSLETTDCDHGFLDRRKTERKQSGAEPRQFVGQRVVEKLRRLRRPKSGAPAGLHSGEIHPAAESLLLRTSLQRQSRHWPQARSVAGRSVVQRSVSRAGRLRLQGPLDCDSQGKQGRLRAVGRRRTVSDRPLAIRFRQRTSETKSEQGRWSRCFAGGAR